MLFRSRIEGFIDDDRELVAAVSEAEDREAFVRQCMRVGARALQAVNVTIDAQVVEKRFDEMSGIIPYGAILLSGVITLVAAVLLGIVLIRGRR